MLLFLDKIVNEKRNVVLLLFVFVVVAVVSILVFTPVMGKTTKPEMDADRSDPKLTVKKPRPSKPDSKNSNRKEAKIPPSVKQSIQSPADQEKGSSHQPDGAKKVDSEKSLLPPLPPTSSTPYLLQQDPQHSPDLSPLLQTLPDTDPPKRGDPPLLQPKSVIGQSKQPEEISSAPIQTQTHHQPPCTRTDETTTTSTPKDNTSNLDQRGENTL